MFSAEPLARSKGAASALRHHHHDLYSESMIPNHSLDVYALVYRCTSPPEKAKEKKKREKGVERAFAPPLPTSSSSSSAAFFMGSKCLEMRKKKKIMLFLTHIQQKSHQATRVLCHGVFDKVSATFGVFVSFSLSSTHHHGQCSMYRYGLNVFIMHVTLPIYLSKHPLFLGINVVTILCLCPPPVPVFLSALSVFRILHYVFCTPFPSSPFCLVGG